MTYKVLVVDDSSFFRRRVTDILNKDPNLEVVDVAINGQEAVDKAILLKPDVITMDIEMPILNGIQATEIIKQKYPQIKIIMLTVFDDDENIFNAIKAGADGYLLKEVNPKDLYNGINETLEVGAAMTPSIAMKTLKLLRNPFAVKNIEEQESIALTPREVEVLEQLSKGLSYNLIAENLFLSVGTIRKHIENIYKKLQVHNKLEAVQKARKNNLI